MFFPVSLSKIIIFANILLLLSISTVGAAEEEIEDYSKGFEVFYKLGLPDVSNAEYVKLDFDGINPCSSFNAGSFSTGNGWLLKNEGNDSPSSFIIFNALSLKVYDGEKLFEEFKIKNKKPDMKYDEFLAQNKSNFIGSWKSEDIKDDVAKVLFMMENYGDEDWYMPSGVIFLYAIQFHSKGFKKEANKMMSVLFKKSGDKKAVLLDAMSALATQQYEQALLDLFESDDWKKFGNDLDALLKKYPRGWKAASGVRLLYKMVQKQLANPVPPEIKGEGISEEDKKLAAEFVNIKEVPYSYGLRVVLPQNKGKKNYDPEDDVIEKIKARGKAAVPMLTALLQDDYMITAYSKGYVLGDTDAEKTLSTISHPVRRKDIARNLLLPAIAFSEERERVDVNNLSDSELAEVCRIWYDEIKSKTDEELMFYYLKNGDKHQKNCASESMMYKDTAKYLSVIEEFILESEKENLLDDFNFLEDYVEIRGKAAAPFVEKLKAKFKDELAIVEKYRKKEEEKQAKEQKEEIKSGEDEEKEETEEEPPQYYEYERLKETLDFLSILSEGKSAKQLIDELRPEANNQLTCRLLESMLEKMDRADSLDIILYGIKQHRDNLAFRIYFINLLMGFFCGEQLPGAQNKPFAIEKDSEIWKELLEDKRFMYETESVEINIGSVAEFLIEDIYGDEKGIKKAKQLVNIAESKSHFILRKRAEERLEGKKEEELTPYPEIRKLNEKETEKLAADIQKAATENNVSKFIDNMGLSEFVALPELFDKNPKLNEGLKSYANRIVKVKSLIKGEEKALDVFKDSELDMKAIEKILEYCKKLGADEKKFRCYIERKAFFEGVNIILSENESEVFPEFRMLGKIDAVSGSVFAEWNVGGKGTKENVDEIVVDGKKIKLETADEDKTTEGSPEKFIKALKNILGDEQNCSSSFIILFTDIDSDLDWRIE